MGTVRPLRENRFCSIPSRRRDFSILPRAGASFCSSRAGAMSTLELKKLMLKEGMIIVVAGLRVGGLLCAWCFRVWICEQNFEVKCFL